jgi:small multidrug resistance family-3 protein
VESLATINQPFNRNSFLNPVRSIILQSNRLIVIIDECNCFRRSKVNQDIKKFRKILITLFFFLLAGLCEIGGGYLVWLWLREDMSWILGAIGGFILFLYGIVPTFQPSYFHRIYAAYGGIFIVMALLWGLIFEGIVPDMYDIIGAAMACVGVAIIYYAPRKGEEKLWSNH